MDPGPGGSLLAEGPAQRLSASATEGGIGVGFSLSEDGASGVATYIYISCTGEASHNGVRAPFGPCFQAGDVIGCGLEATTSQIFYTRNGEYLGAAFMEVPHQIAAVLHPTVVMDAPGAECTGNFGQDPFCFDPDLLLGRRSSTLGHGDEEEEEAWATTSGEEGQMPFLPLKERFESYLLPGPPSAQPSAVPNGEMPRWWNATMLPLASPRSLPASTGDDIELRNLSHRADVEVHVMLQEVLTFTRAVVSLRVSLQEEGAMPNLRQFVALGGRILRRCSAAACVAMDDGTRASLLILNERLSVLVAAVQTKLNALDAGTQLLLALGETSSASHDEDVKVAVQGFTSPEAIAAVISLVAENSDAGAGLVDERRPIISLVASAVLGLLSLLDDREIAGQVEWYGLRPLVGLAFEPEDPQSMAVTASAALALMAAHAVDTKRFVKDGALQVVIALLLPEDPVVRRLGATALARLSAKAENKVLLVQEGVLQPLLELCGSLTDTGVLQLVVHVLSNMMDIPENLDKLLEHRGLAVTVDLLTSNEPDIRTKAAKILSHLVTVPKFKALVGRTEAIPRLVSCLSPSLLGDMELYAASVISKIAGEEGDEFKIKIVQHGGLQPLLCLAYPMVTRTHSSTSVVKPVTPPTFPRMHRRSASESGMMRLEHGNTDDTLRTRARRSAMVALRHIALDEQFHSAIIEAPAFRWVLHAFNDSEGNVAREAVRLARQCTMHQDIGPALCETDTALKGLVALANRNDSDVSTPALDILANVTFTGGDLHANRLAVSKAGLVSALAARDNVGAQQRFAVVQIIANLVETPETRLITVDQGGLKLLMEMAVAAQPHSAADVFMGTRDINAEVGRALEALTKEVRLWESILEQGLPWLLRSIGSPESDHQRLAAERTMKTLGFDTPNEATKLGDASMVLVYWKLSTGLLGRRTEDPSCSSLILPSRRYWTFNSFAPVLAMLVEKYVVDALHFSDAQFGGKFETEFFEVLGQFPELATVKFRWSEEIDSSAEDDILVIVAQLQNHVHTVGLEGPLSAGALKKFCSMLRSKPMIQNISLSLNCLRGDEIGPLLAMLRERSVVGLDLKGNYLGDKGCQEVCEVVAESAYDLRRLGLGFNAIGRHSLDAIANMITRAQLSSLDLRGNNLGRRDQAGGSVLSCLSPSHLGKGRDAAESLGQLRIAVYSSSTLYELHLDHNGHLNPQDETSIEERLAHNKAVMPEEIPSARQGAVTSGEEDPGYSSSNSDASTGSHASRGSFGSHASRGSRGGSFGAPHGALIVQRASSVGSVVSMGGSTESGSPSGKGPSPSPPPPWESRSSYDPPAYEKEPTIMILFAAPLAYTTSNGTLQGLELLDYEQERELLYHTVNETGAAIDVQFRFATTDTFRSVVTIGGCRVLHYSGHGSKQFLGMEDGRAGMHKVEVEALRQLFAAGGHSDVQLVFVSACRSRNAAEAFISVGVPFVVAVEADSQVTDVAARSFTRAFYLALSKGKSVQGSFDIAQQAVSTSPQVHQGIAEAAKFVLIGKDAHSVAIFDDVGTCGPRPIPLLANDVLPVNTEGFLGRSLEMYDAVHSCLDRRLVTIIGEPGIGKNTLAIASANYISERRTGCFQSRFGDGVHFIDAMGMTSVSELQSMLSEMLLREKGTPMSDLLAATRAMRALVVIVNGHSLWETCKTAVEEFVKALLTQTRGVRLLVTAQDSLSNLGIRLGGTSEKIVKLGPLSNEDAARVFYRRAPRRITPSEFGVSSPMEVLRALATHPLITSVLCGRPGRIVEAVAHLEASVSVGDLVSVLLRAGA